MSCNTRNFHIGYEIPPVSHQVTQEKINAYSRFVFGGRDLKNIHTDNEVAERAGLPATVAQGRYPLAYISEELLGLFGRGWVEGGQLSVTIAKPVYAGDTVTVRGTVKDRVIEGTATRLVLDVWLENQNGEKVIVGTASGLVLPEED